MLRAFLTNLFTAASYLCFESGCVHGSRCACPHTPEPRFAEGQLNFDFGRHLFVVCDGRAPGALLRPFLSVSYFGGCLRLVVPVGSGGGSDPRGEVVSRHSPMEGRQVKP